MIYTVGHRKSYNRGLALPEPLIKLGPRSAGEIANYEEAYPGGIAFITPEEAREYIEQNGLTGYSVYVLDGEVEDMYESKPGETSIKRDLRILKEYT